MHHSYSVYITVAKGKVWAEKKIDHDITKLVCNIADTALPPREAAEETLTIIREMVGKDVNGSRRPANVWNEWRMPKERRNVTSKDESRRCP